MLRGAAAMLDELLYGTADASAGGAWWEAPISADTWESPGFDVVAAPSADTTGDVVA